MTAPSPPFEIRLSQSFSLSRTRLPLNISAIFSRNFSSVHACIHVWVGWSSVLVL